MREPAAPSAVEVDEYIRQLGVLHELGQELGRAVDEGAFLRIAAAYIRRILPPIDRATIALAAADGAHLTLFALDAAEPGLASALSVGVRLAAERTMLGIVIREQRLVVFEGEAFERSDLVDLVELRRLGVRSSMDAPLIVGGAVIGTVNTASVLPAPYGPRERELLERVAALMAAHIERFRLVGQLHGALAEARRNAAHMEREARVLRSILQGTAGETGEGFLQSLVRHLAAALGVRWACFSVPVAGGASSPARARTVAFWDTDRFLPNVELDLSLDPCGETLRGRACCHPRGVRQLFPDATIARRLGVEAYIGVPLLDAAGGVLAGLAVMADRPLEDDDEAPGEAEGSAARSLRVIRIFAARAQAELLRLRAEGELEAARRGAEAANHAKSAFLAKMSHELRTPLTAVLGFTRLLCREPGLSPQQEEYLRIIRRSGEHLLSLINDTLEMSRIEAGRVALHPEVFDVCELVAGVEAMLRLRAEEKGLTLRVELGADLPCGLRADAAKLRQVLVNLVGNAIKFTERGGVVLRVRAPSEAPDAAEVRLHVEVEDTGPGIDPREHAALFDPFYQAEAGRRSHEGTGLGLPISRQFVRLLGGELTLRSELGRGACFRFDVRGERADGPTSGVTLRGPTASVIRLAEGQAEVRVLVAEDRRENRILLCRLLRSAGFTVVEARDGGEAVEQYARHAPHLIWMDMAMPRVDGREATRRIRAMESPGARRPVIIALTASAFEEEREAVLALGCDDFVSKPFQEEELFEKMALHLGVRYRQEDGRPAARPPPGAGPTPAELRALPPEIVAALRDAAVQLDPEQTGSIIERIRPAAPELADGLSTLLRGFDFDRLLKLTEGV